MNQKYSKLAVALSIALLTLASAAGAAVLWDQSTFDPSAPAMAASNSPGFGGFVAHTVNDVVVPADGWHVTSISQYYSGFNYSWTSMTVGYINIIPKTGALPTGTPSAVLQPMSCVEGTPFNGSTVFIVTANVSLDLVPGEYWIGLTPNGSAGINGANLLWGSAMLGAPVATYLSPSPWANYYGAYDGAFKITGDLNTPVPTAGTTWGRIKSIYR
jgi:hypothetical protein